MTPKSGYRCGIGASTITARSLASMSSQMASPRLCPTVVTLLHSKKTKMGAGRNSIATYLIKDRDGEDEERKTKI